MKYYVAENTGKGFITHEENESNYIQGFPANVYATENSSWASRVGATEKTKVEAQSLVDASVQESRTQQQNYINSLEDGEEKTRLQEELDNSPETVLLP